MPTTDVTTSAVAPNFGAVVDGSRIHQVIGALLTYGLLVAVLMLICSALAWAFASHSGSWHQAEKAKAGLLVALGGAALTGAALVWANFLLGVGAHL